LFNQHTCFCLALRNAAQRQKAVLAADVRLKKQLAVEGHGEVGAPSRTQQRFIDTGVVSKRLRSIDAGTLSAVDDMAEVAAESMETPSEAAAMPMRAHWRTLI
jgi:hypothetical protein